LNKTGKINDIRSLKMAPSTKYSFCVENKVVRNSLPQKNQWLATVLLRQGMTGGESLKTLTNTTFLVPVRDPPT